MGQHFQDKGAVTRYSKRMAEGDNIRRLKDSSPISTTINTLPNALHLKSIVFKDGITTVSTIFQKYYKSNIQMALRRYLNVLFCVHMSCSVLLLQNFFCHPLRHFLILCIIYSIC